MLLTRGAGGRGSSRLVDCELATLVAASRLLLLVLVRVLVRVRLAQCLAGFPFKDRPLGQI